MMGVFVLLVGAGTDELNFTCDGEKATKIPEKTVDKFRAVVGIDAAKREAQAAFNVARPSMLATSDSSRTASCSLQAVKMSTVLRVWGKFPACGARSVKRGRFLRIQGRGRSGNRCYRGLCV